MASEINKERASRLGEPEGGREESVGQFLPAAAAPYATAHALNKSGRALQPDTVRKLTEDQDVEQPAAWTGRCWHDWTPAGITCMRSNQHLENISVSIPFSFFWRTRERRCQATGRPIRLETTSREETDPDSEFHSFPCQASNSSRSTVTASPCLRLRGLFYVET